MFRFQPCISFSARLSLPTCISRQKGRSQSTYCTLHSRSELIKKLSPRTLIIPREMKWATLLPFGPVKGHKWFFQIFSQWKSQKNRFTLISFGKTCFYLPAFEISRGGTTWTGDFKCREAKTGFCRNRPKLTGSSGTLIGWKSGQTTFVPLLDRMEGAWLWTLFNSYRLSGSHWPKTIGTNNANTLQSHYLSVWIIFLFWLWTIISYLTVQLFSKFPSS